MSFATFQAIKQIRGALLKQPEGIDYESLSLQLEKVPSGIFDEAIAELIAKGELKDQDGHYTLLTAIMAIPEVNSGSKDRTHTAQTSKPTLAVVASTPAQTQPPSEDKAMAKGRMSTQELRLKIVKAIKASSGALSPGEIHVAIGAKGAVSGTGYHLRLMAKEGLLVAEGASNSRKYAASDRLPKKRGGGAALEASNGAQDLVEKQLRNAVRATEDALQEYIDKTCSGQTFELLRKGRDHSRQQLDEYLSQRMG